MHCPLCGHDGPMPAPRWARPVRYDGRRFDYRSCGACGSAACDPMPDADVLAQMYDTGYAADDDLPVQASYDGWVLDVLAGLPPGRFLDYGCGDGRLLPKVAAAGWEAVGVEYDDDVVVGIGARTDCPTFTTSEAGRAAPVDVLHLGDVVEHLVDPAGELATVLELLRPGGLLLAQGPLEAEPNLFTGVVHLVGRMARGAPVELAPYHVLLATARGQLALFERLGLQTVQYDVFETSWPAPDRPFGAGRSLHSVGLWGVRRASMALGARTSGRWGNRYRFAGTLPATAR